MPPAFLRPRAAVAVLFPALALGLLLASGRPAGAATPAGKDLLLIDAAQQVALGVRLATVRPATAAALELPARVVAPASAQALVAAPAPGVITAVAVAGGEAVHRGQLLATLHSSEVAQLQREREQARLQWQLDRQQAQRDSRLYAEGIIAASRQQAAAARERQARALLGERELALRLAGATTGVDGRVRLLAPIDGVVAQVQALPGQRVDVATPLFHLLAPGALLLELDATAAQAQALRPGAAVEVAQAGARGVLLSVAPSLSPTQSVVLRARLSRAGALHAGALVQARVHLPPRPGLHVVPPAALTRIAGRESVLVAVPTGFRIVPVAVQARLADSVVVSGPLRDGEQVAASGVIALKAAAEGRP